jgi:membrane protein DedA with SNARE-associated domain
VVSASLGAIGGFWLSWLTGFAIGTICIVSAGCRRALARGQLFLRRHGAWAVFFSRFLSRCAPPCRWSAAPAGPLAFQLANVSSGLLWPLLLLLARRAKPQFW